MRTKHEQEDQGVESVIIEKGKLTTQVGSWKLSKVSSVFKRNGEQVSLGRFMVFFAGVTAAQAAGTLIASAATGLTLMAVLGGGAAAYFMHRTKSVIILVGNEEIEICGEIYFPGIWLEDHANNVCDRLVRRIRRQLKKGQDMRGK